VREEIYPWCTDWAIKHLAVKTDHRLVSIEITSENMPYLGKGRWAIPIGLLKNRMLKKQTQKLARELQNKVKASIREGCEIKNPQQALKTFKSNIVETYRKHQKSIQPRIINTIKTLEKGVRETMNSATLTEDQHRSEPDQQED